MDVIDILDEMGIPHLVIGALAASVHGEERSSRDADALVSLRDASASLEDLASRFRMSGYRVELRRGDSEDPIAAVLQVFDSHQNQVDLLAGLRGLDAEAFARGVRLELEGRTINIVGVEDFIAMKLFAGSAQDIRDARSAFQISREMIDVSLLHRLCEKFGAECAGNLKQLQ